MHVYALSLPAIDHTITMMNTTNINNWIQMNGISRKTQVMMVNHRVLISWCLVAWRSVLGKNTTPLFQN